MMMRLTLRQMKIQPQRLSFVLLCVLVASCKFIQGTWIV